MNDAYDLTINDWVFRIQPPLEHPAKAVLVAIHGLTGNQFSMEIFTHKLRRTFWIIYPRAPFAAKSGGFSWVPDEHGYYQDVLDLEEISSELSLRVDLIQQELTILHLPVYLMGFSQGAAFALVYSLRFPSPGDKIGLLSGFLPEGLAPIVGKLDHRKYYVAHGKQDTTIPISRGRKLVKFLEQSGACVEYCEADTGHKLSMDCFKQLEDFFDPE